MELVLSIVGTALGAAGLVYAVMTNREKANLERLVRSELRGLAGNIWSIRKNPRWADRHFGRIHDIAAKLETNEQVTGILRAAQTGARDAVAAERMLGNLLNEVLCLQEGLFGTKEIEHPNGKTQDESATTTG